MIISTPISDVHRKVEALNLDDKHELLYINGKRLVIALEEHGIVVIAEKDSSDHISEFYAYISGSGGPMSGRKIAAFRGSEWEVLPPFELIYVIKALDECYGIVPMMRSALPQPN